MAPEAWQSRRVLLAVTGGIAAYKSALLARLLVKAGADVQVLMTAGAHAFIQPLTFQALTGRAVRSDLLDEQAEQGMGHIELARWPDLIVIAPASADAMARAAAGMADDLLTTVLLATRKPVFWVPAMNQAMWSHPLTQRNLAILAEIPFYTLFDTAEGAQACGDTGPGRMLEPEQIVALLTATLSAEEASPQRTPAPVAAGILSGTRVVLTAGPTREYIDPVRFVSNESSGRMGYALAAAAISAGAEVTLISGPVGIPAPDGVQLASVTSAEQMLQAALAATAEGCDIFIAAAAVADYRPASPAGQKLKKQAAAAQLSQLQLVENPDVLKSVADSHKVTYLVGFAAETEQLAEHARSKLTRKGIDLIVANDVSRTDIGFNSDFNEVLLIDHEQTQRLERQSKTQLGQYLLAEIVTRWQHKQANEPGQNGNGRTGQ
ncbi:bifunctional phosphopantothenoylcysteine decarboxylase/phosphopantothenate--cysteine ligase CoaBC [Allohahella marinimesophila]|uniref:Coenzyme A biosynthesis bifunctional protein CoaBC n=1 Tax=Allohahella marinimesophila TaxID=1054972 RepID=A0ABP7PJN6_9GAMM